MRPQAVILNRDNPDDRENPKIHGIVKLRKPTPACPLDNHAFVKCGLSNNRSPPMSHPEDAAAVAETFEMENIHVADRRGHRHPVRTTQPQAHRIHP